MRGRFRVTRSDATREKSHRYQNLEKGDPMGALMNKNRIREH
jgi:hypothetical protein